MKYFDYVSEFDGPQSYVSCGRRILCKGGGGGSGNTTTTQSIPEELKPLATKYTQKATALADQAYNPYQGQRYADFNVPQLQGLDMIQNRALSGSATVNNAEAGLNQMISGDSSNPYLDASVSKALGAVKGQVNSQFGGNNFGTTAHQETLTNALGNTANEMYSNNYQQDQSRRLQAIGQAPTFGNQAYSDASQLLNAGQIKQDQVQQGLDYGYQQYQEQQNLPYKQLAAMSGVFNSNLGSTSSTEGGGGGGK